MSEMLFGFSRQTINPRVRVSLAGYFTLRYWERIHDDIVVQSLAVRHDDRIAVLLQFDLVTIPRDITLAVRQACGTVPGLSEGGLILTASHTHTAPVVRSERPGGNPEYNRMVIEQAVRAVRSSLSDLAPGTIEYGAAHNAGLAFNRRYWMQDGRVVTNPPRCDPGIDRPEGPIDPHIGLVRIRRPGRRTVLLANISNHPDTIGGNAVSADWHGVIRASLESDDPALRVITVTAAEGNVNHFNPSDPSGQSGFEVAHRLGSGYADSIRAALPGLQSSATETLRTATETFRAGPREIPEEDVAQARHDADVYAGAFSSESAGQLTSEDLATGSPAALKYFADRLLELAADRSDRELEVSVLRMGDVALVALPGEPFVEYGMRIRNELRPGLPTLVAALSDGRAMYIPTPSNFGRGGYETTPRSSPYTMQTGELMIQAVARLLDRID
jgi:hypothetical protein